MDISSRRRRNPKERPLETVAWVLASSFTREGATLVRTQPEAICRSGEDHLPYFLLCQLGQIFEVQSDVNVRSTEKVSFSHLAIFAHKVGRIFVLNGPEPRHECLRRCQPDRLCPAFGLLCRTRAVVANYLLSSRFTSSMKSTAMRGRDEPRRTAALATILVSGTNGRVMMLRLLAKSAE